MPSFIHFKNGQSRGGVTDSIAANGGSLALTIGDVYYVEAYSDVTFPLSEGTPVYAQADSVNFDTDYGNVLEKDELDGLVYNNISGPVLSTAQITAKNGATDHTINPSAWPLNKNLPLRE